MGSAYFDINILTTPVIEALTNNTSTMKNRLLSIPKTNLLYLPTMILNEETCRGTTKDQVQTFETFFVSVDDNTDDFLHNKVYWSLAGPSSIPQWIFLVWSKRRAKIACCNRPRFKYYCYS